MTDRPAEKDDERVQDGEDVQNDEQQVHVPGIRELPSSPCARRSSSPR